MHACMSVDMHVPPCLRATRLTRLRRDGADGQEGSGETGLHGPHRPAAGGGRCLLGPHAHVQTPNQGPSGNDMEIVMNGAIINEIGYGMKVENGYMDKAVAHDAVNGLVLLL